MPERVVPLDLGVEWNAIEENAVLMSDGLGNDAVVVLSPHHDDPDQRDVLLVFSDTTYALSGGPNDEARHQHRLYEKGLNNIVWIGVVENSELADDQAARGYAEAAARPRPAHDPSTHYVLVTKGQIFEILARGVTVARRSDAQSAVWQLIRSR